MELKDIIAQQQALKQQQSALGQQSGGVTSGMSALSGAASGASAGAMFGPYGAAIGGVIGGVGGLMKGNAQKAALEEQQAAMNLQSNVLENSRINLQNTSNEFRNGGQLTRFNGESHEAGGIRIGKDEVEGGETMLDNYIFSNYLSPKGANKTFAELSGEVDDSYLRKNDRFSEASKTAKYQSLRDQQDAINEEFGEGTEIPKEFRCGGKRKMADDIVGRKYIRGGVLGDPFKKIKGYDAEQAFQEAGIPYTSENRDKFEKFAQEGKLLPKHGLDHKFGPEYNAALQAGLKDGLFESIQMPSAAPIGPESATSAEPTRLVTQEQEGLPIIGATDPNAYNFQLPGDDPYAAPQQLQAPTVTGLGELEAPVTDIGGLTQTADNTQSVFGAQGGTPSGGGVNFSALAQSLPGLIGAATNFGLSKKVNYDRVQPQTVDANLLDPRRALQEQGTAFSGANQQLQGLQGGQYMSNRLASAASEAQSRGQVIQGYDEANAQILNRTDLANAGARSQANLVNLQQSTQETQDRIQALGAAGSELSKGVGATLGAFNTDRRDRRMLPFLGTENFKAYVERGGDPALYMDSMRGDNRYNYKVVGNNKNR